MAPTSTLGKYYNMASYVASKVPGLAYVAYQTTLYGKPKAYEDYDIRAVLHIAAIKSALGDGPNYEVEYVQRLTAMAGQPGTHMWGVHEDVKVSQERLNLIEDAVDNVIKRLKPEDMDAAQLPKAKGHTQLTAEWQAARSETKAHDTNTTHAERYKLMQNDLTSDSVVLYFHGGAYYLGDPKTHRDIVYRLAGSFGGKCFSVRYRLAPQDPFPAGLVDALAAYDYLVNPPAGALHEPIDPSKIVLAGDSAGGGLVAALMAVLIESKPLWALPAGLCLLSPWVDLSHSFTSCLENEADYLPSMQGEIKGHKKSDAWAADGSQRQFYCKNEMVMHPLVSPVLYQDWKQSCPVTIQVGAEERLRDEGRYLAQCMLSSGVPVQYEEWKSGVHVFQMLFYTETSRRSFKSMGMFIRAVTSQNSVKTRSGQEVVSGRVKCNNKGQKEVFEDDEYGTWSTELVKSRMNQRRKNFSMETSNKL